MSVIRLFLVLFISQTVQVAAATWPVSEVVVLRSDTYPILTDNQDVTTNWPSLEPNRSWRKRGMKSAAEARKWRAFEKRFNTKIIPELKALGLEPPNLAETITTPSGEKAHPIYLIKDLDESGAFYPDCLGSFITRLIELDDKPPSTSAKTEVNLAHELIHAIASTYEPCHTTPAWIDEGLTQGVASYVVARSMPELFKDLILPFDPSTNSTNGASHFLGFRNFVEPLDLPYTSNDSLSTKTLPGFPNRKEIAPYQTGSFFRYLIEAMNGDGSIILAFLSEQWSEKIDDNRKKFRKILNAQTDLNGFDTILAKFYTELASWPGGRHDVSAAASFKEQHDRYLSAMFGCKKQETIEFKGAEGGLLGGMQKIPFGEIEDMSARCIRVKWSGVSTPAPLHLSFLTNSDQASQALHVGVPYVTGAAKNQPKYEYCFQALRNSDDMNVMAAIDNRLKRAYSRSCLLTPQITRGANDRGEPYFLTSFKTGFLIGSAAGEAHFIVTAAHEQTPSNKKIEFLGGVGHALIVASDNSMLKNGVHKFFTTVDVAGGNAFQDAQFSLARDPNGDEEEQEDDEETVFAAASSQPTAIEKYSNTVPPEARRFTNLPTQLISQNTDASEGSATTISVGDWKIVISMDGAGALQTTLLSNPFSQSGRRYLGYGFKDGECGFEGTTELIDRQPHLGIALKISAPIWDMSVFPEVMARLNEQRNLSAQEKCDIMYRDIVKYTEQMEIYLPVSPLRLNLSPITIVDYPARAHRWSERDVLGKPIPGGLPTE